jgi:hypothetical protein
MLISEVQQAMVDYPLANKDYLKALRKLLEMHHTYKPKTLTAFHQCKNFLIAEIENDYDPSFRKESLTQEDLIKYISDKHLLLLAPILLEETEALVRLKREEKLS